VKEVPKWMKVHQNEYKILFLFMTMREDEKGIE